MDIPWKGMAERESGMESKKLEALMMSVDLGSFTRAAEVLGYTQSGLTHMMNSLEKEIGVPLLERGRSGVRLTPEGERVAPAIRDFLDSASRLDAALTQAGDVRREAIRVGTYASMGVHWLPGIIRRFREECPEASVEMRVTNHIAEAYAALLQGKLDLIFASRQEPGDYQWISLWQDPMFAVLPPEDPHRGRFPLGDFQGLDFIMPYQGFDLDIMRIFRAAGVQPNVQPSVVDDLTVISMVRHGLGVSMMTEMTLRGYTQQVLTLPVAPTASRELGIALRPHCANPALRRRFIDCARRVVWEMTGENDANATDISAPAAL